MAVRIPGKRLYDGIDKLAGEAGCGSDAFVATGDAAQIVFSRDEGVAPTGFKTHAAFDGHCSKLTIKQVEVVPRSFMSLKIIVIHDCQKLNCYRIVGISYD